MYSHNKKQNTELCHSAPSLTILLCMGVILKCSKLIAKFHLVQCELMNFLNLSHCLISETTAVFEATSKSSSRKSVLSWQRFCDGSGPGTVRDCSQPDQRSASALVILVIDNIMHCFSKSKKRSVKNMWWQ